MCRAKIDDEEGLIRVRRQIPAGRREVILAPGNAKLLRERWLASAYKRPGDFVFANTLGPRLDYRDAGEGFRHAVKHAGLSAPGRLSLHSLRHAFASLRIANGLDVGYVPRQLGHANPTLSAYAHLFERADHAATAREALQASYARTIGPGA